MNNGMKYKVGQIWYMKRGFKSLEENRPVEIMRVYKKGRRTFVDVYDSKRNIITDVPATTKLRRKHK